MFSPNMLNSKTVLNVFIKIVNECNCKPNKLWVDQGREFYNKFMQEWLDNNDMLMYSTHNEGNLVVNEKFIKRLKTKIYKKMTANNSKSYLSYLNILVNQYNNNYRHSIGKKLVNAEYSVLTEKIETNPKASKLKVNFRVRTITMVIIL